MNEHLGLTESSTHRAEVVPVELEVHPNANKLSLVRVGEYVVVVATGDWQGVKKAVYIQPDSVVPDLPQYAFLNAEGPLREKDRRIRVKRLRKILSQGLLMPLPAGYEHSQVGTDLAGPMSITRWEPPEPVGGVNGNGKGKGEAAKGPAFMVPIYGVENWYKFASELHEGEKVAVTEKIHGANWRGVFDGTTLHVGSHRTWKRHFIKQSLDGLKWWQKWLCRWGLRAWPTRPDGSVWWRVVEQHPLLEAFCRANPGLVLFSEVYGPGVQDLHYALKEGQLGFVAFDVWNPRAARWLSALERAELELVETLKWAPLLWEGSYTKEGFKKLIDGNSRLAPAQIREGVVIESLEHRCKLKAVSNDYLERS